MIFADPRIAGSDFNAFSCSTCHEAKAGDANGRLLPGGSLAGVTQRPSYWGGHELDLLRSINYCLGFFMLKDEPWAAGDAPTVDLYAHLDSLESSGSEGPALFTVVRDVADPPPGVAAAGKELFGRACATCHGEIHSGAGRLVDRASVLPDDVLDSHPLGTYTPLERRLVFVEKIRHGGFLGQTGQMPPFSGERLSDQDIGDLLAFFGVP